MLRLLLLLLSLSALCVLAADCVPACKQWQSPAGTVRLQFTPCQLSVSDLEITYSNGLRVVGTGPSVYDCSAFGSGVSLSIFVPTDHGQATLQWVYADSQQEMFCNGVLRSTAVDLRIETLGLSVAVGGAPLLVWSDRAAGIGRARCTETASAQPTWLQATFANRSECLSNAGAPYLLRDAHNTDAAWLQWTASTASGAVTLVLNGTQLAPLHAASSCVQSNDAIIVRLWDSETHLWSLVWIYDQYESCAALAQDLLDEQDAPPVKQTIVAVVGARTYQREINGEQTAPFSQLRVRCDLHTPSVAVATVAATRPVQPFVECASRANGQCVAVFGYHNPNTHAIELQPDSPENELLLRTGAHATQLPRLFEPGVHNHTLEVRYACSPRGSPAPLWRLRTPVTADVAAQLLDSGCAQNCHESLLDELDECVTSARNGDDTTPVMRCARAVARDGANVCV